MDGEWVEYGRGYGIQEMVIFDLCLSQDCGTCHAAVTIQLECGHNVRCDCGARNLAR